MDSRERLVARARAKIAGTHGAWRYDQMLWIVN